MSRESALPVRNREWWATTTGMNGLNFDEYNVDVTKLILHSHEGENSKGITYYVRDL